MIMATMHNIPVDESPEGHTHSRNCKCKPTVLFIGGGRVVNHKYMNHPVKKVEIDNG